MNSSFAQTNKQLFCSDLNSSFAQTDEQFFCLDLNIYFAQTNWQFFWQFFPRPMDSSFENVALWQLKMLHQMDFIQA